MIRLSLLCMALVIALVIAPPISAATSRNDDPQAEVRAAETAFAAAMAERDFDAFQRHIADDAVFVSGGKALRGKAAVLAHWARFFEDTQAPFSWKADLVEALPTGTLAYSTGPVQAPDGTLIAQFASTWRREPSGEWRVVFDNGHAVCSSR